MNDIPRQKLQYIVMQYGRAICNEPKRCEALLRDLCPEHKREINVLISALRQRVTTELLNNSDATAKEVLLENLSRRLYDNLGIAKEFAIWAVDSWAFALGAVSKTPDRKPDASAQASPEAKNRKWWDLLNSRWKKIFKKALGIDHEPDANELAKIMELEKLDCRLSWLQITDLEPLRKLPDLKMLNCRGTQISSLEPLKDLISLRILNCQVTPIRSLEPIQSLSNLQILQCRGTQISSLSPVHRLVNLRKLDCDGTRINTLKPLKNLRRLEELDCDRTRIMDLEGLRDLRNLRELSCNSNEISSLNPLRHLTRLTVLNCNSNYIRSLGPLRNLTQVRVLNCNYNQISQLEPIQDLVNLQKLGCDETQIKSLKPLQHLTNLHIVHCRNTRVSMYEKLRFRIKHPSCTVNPEFL